MPSSYKNTIKNTARRVRNMSEFKDISTQSQKAINEEIKKAMQAVKQIPDVLGYTPTGKVRTKEKALERLFRKAGRVGMIPNIKPPKSNRTYDNTRKTKDGSEAIYKPGNLLDSIKLMKFKRSNSIFVGPKTIRQKKKTGTFGPGSRQDPYYAGFVEFGTRSQGGQGYMKKGIEKGTKPTLKIIKDGVEKMLKKWYDQRRKSNK